MSLTRYQDKVIAVQRRSPDPRPRVASSRALSERPATRAPAVALGALARAPQEVRVKFMGGREVTGVLKGSDKLLNLVLDDTKEYLKDPNDPYKLLDETRPLGLTVCRGTTVMLISPVDGYEEIANPFLQAEGAE